MVGIHNLFHLLLLFLVAKLCLTLCNTGDCRKQVEGSTISSVQSLSHVGLFATPWITAHHWCLERLKAGGEGDNRRQDGWMASLIQWTWVWASSGWWWRTGKSGMLQSMGLQRAGHDWKPEQQQALGILTSILVFYYNYLLICLFPYFIHNFAFQVSVYIVMTSIHISFMC